MLLTDFFAQNAIGLPAQTRVALTPGLQAWQVADGQSLMRLIVHLAYSEGYDPDAKFASADPSRAGFLFDHPAGAKHRLLRDLQSGAAQLGKMEGQAVTALATTGADVAAQLRATMKLPARDWFDHVLWLRPERFPSERRKNGGGATAAPGAPKLRDRGIVEAELRELQAQKGATTGAIDTEALEFELDGIQKQKFRFEDLQNKRLVLSETVKKAQRVAQGAAALAQVPRDFQQRYDAYQRAEKKLQDERAKILAELQQLNENGEPPTPDPVWRDARFLGGIGAGVVLLIGAAFLPGDYRFIGLLDVVPFGLSTIQSLSWISELEAKDQHGSRKHLLTDLETRVSQRLEKEAAPIRAIIKATGLDVADIIEGLAARDVHLGGVKVAEEALRAFDAGDGLELQSVELKRLNERSNEIEAQLLSTSVGTGSANVQRRLNELDRELALIDQQAAAPVALSAGGFDPGSERRLVLAVAEALGGDADSAAQKIAQRAAQYLGRWTGAERALSLALTGDLTVGGAALSGLPDADANAAVLALSLAAFELAAPVMAFPLWVEGLHRVQALPHAVVPPYLQHIAKRGQVVWLISGNESVPDGVPRHALV